MKVLLVVVVLVLLTGACGVPENIVKEREQEARRQGLITGAIYGQQKAEQVCREEKREMQTTHNNEMKTAVDNAVTETQIGNGAAILSGFVGGVIVSVIVAVFVLLLGAIGVLFVMFRKREDYAFNEFFDSLKG